MLTETGTGTESNTDTSQPPAGPERRRALRKHVLWSGQIEANARLLDCAVLDISLEGARVRLDETIPARGPIAIAFGRFGRFQAEVVWEREHVVGLRFLEPPGRVADTIGRQLPLALNA